MHLQVRPRRRAMRASRSSSLTNRCRERTLTALRVMNPVRMFPSSVRPRPIAAGWLRCRFDHSVMRTRRVRESRTRPGRSPHATTVVVDRRCAIADASCDGDVCVSCSRVSATIRVPGTSVPPVHVDDRCGPCGRSRRFRNQATSCTTSQPRFHSCEDVRFCDDVRSCDDVRMSRARRRAAVSR